MLCGDAKSWTRAQAHVVTCQKGLNPQGQSSLLLTHYTCSECVCVCTSFRSEYNEVICQYWC